MKRALLIAGGTVGGLGAVLSITPPQLGSQGITNLSSSVNGAGSAVASAASSQTAKAVVPQATSGVVSASASSASTSASPKATVKKKTTAVTPKAIVATKKATATPTKKVASTTPTNTTSSHTSMPMPMTNAVNGTFAGSSVFVNYGTVQVEITVVNGKITDAHPLQAPTGRSDRFTQYAVPILRQQTLAAQSANIQGASGASYTSYGWYTSLQVALAKAGL